MCQVDIGTVSLVLFDDRVKGSVEAGNVALMGTVVGNVPSWAQL